MRIEAVAALMAVIVLGSVVAGYYAGAANQRVSTSTVIGPTSSTISTTTYTSEATSTATFTQTIALRPSNPYSTMITQRSLRLELWLNASILHRGGSVRIEMNLTNTLNTTNIIHTADDWPLSQVVAPPYFNPCPSDYPIGIAVYSGYYTQVNVSSGKALSLYPSGTIFCNAGGSSSGYYFKPMSNVAVIPSNYTTTIAVHAVHTINGSWYANPPQYKPQLVPFSPGVYTVIECDEWGDALYLYFRLA